MGPRGALGAVQGRIGVSKKFDASIWAVAPWQLESNMRETNPHDARKMPAAAGVRIRGRRRWSTCLFQRRGAHPQCISKSQCENCPNCKNNAQPPRAHIRAISPQTRFTTSRAPLGRHSRSPPRRRNPHLPLQSYDCALPSLRPLHRSVPYARVILVGTPVAHPAHSRHLYFRLIASFQCRLIVLFLFPAEQI